MNRPEYASVENINEINKINVGDKVRSFDMEFMPFSWIIGTVVGTEVVDGCERYVIEAEKWETCRDENGIHAEVVEVEDKNGRKVYPPVNGSRLMFGEYEYSNLVERI